MVSLSVAQRSKDSEKEEKMRKEYRYKDDKRRDICSIKRSVSGCIR